jgi:hypothetical protein
MANRHGNKEKHLEHEIQEVKRLAEKTAELLEAMLLALELQEGTTIQINEGDTMADQRYPGGAPKPTPGFQGRTGDRFQRTDNIIVAGGAAGTFRARALPVGAIFPPGAALVWAADNPRVTFVPSANGVGTDEDYSAPAAEPAGTFNVTWSIKRTDGTIVNSQPLLVTIQAAGGGGGGGELTDGDTSQVA